MKTRPVTFPTHKLLDDQLITNKMYDHDIFGRVKILDDVGDSILVEQMNGERRIACGFSDRATMLSRFHPID